MGRFNNRLRRLEDRFRDRGPSLEEVNAAFRRIAEVARARLRGESIDLKQMTQDGDIVEKWGRAEGVDLSV
jgi:hypothetical protein